MTTGKTWLSGYGTPQFVTWRSVAYGAGKFVVVGSANGVMTSHDGETWVSRAGPVGGSDWYSVVWNGSTFVAVGGAGGTGTVMSSPDGITWTLQTSATSGSPWASVAWSGTVFAAVGLTSGRSMTSPDGVTWSAGGTSLGNLSGITWGGGQFVAVGRDNRTKTSSDGVTWVNRTFTSSGSYWNAVTYAYGLYVAVGAPNGFGARRMQTSPDGIAWTPRDVWDIGARLRSVGLTGAYLIAAGDEGYVLSSLDGTTWDVELAPVIGTSPMYGGAAWDGTTRVVVGYDETRYTELPPTPPFWADFIAASETVE